ncbi:protein of unknown function [Streptomyces sp. KY75]|nr:protein of unknown function [Streptomyces sp. KY70]CAD5981192.1 protein of unknown function [Streptomyces sp. KY75]
MSDQGRDHGLSVIRPNCPPLTIRSHRWPSPVFPRGGPSGAGHSVGFRRQATLAHATEGSLARGPGKFVNACTHPLRSTPPPVRVRGGRLPYHPVAAHCQFACNGCPLIAPHVFDQR